MPPALVLTGARRGNHVEVRVNAAFVHVSCCSCQLIIDLVLALADSATGSTRADKVAVCRLRNAIDKTLGAGTGAGLIETGMKRQYRLTIPPTGIALTPCFFELVELKIVSADQAELLRPRFPVLKPA